MYLIPLNQMESVELVIHALRAAGGQADCSSCPAHRVCMKQCLSIAKAVEKMLADQTLPDLAMEEGDSEEVGNGKETQERDKGHLKIVK